MPGWSVFFAGDHGFCRDYFEAPTLLDAMCMFFALRGAGYPVRQVREH
jgi:hypothetical protein